MRPPNFYIKFKTFILDIFNIHKEQEEVSDAIELIKKGVEFRGTNLWVLVIATYIASLGLNINSTAVIIGAMLISPLMGPIMGFGLGLGINDLELIKKSAKNFGIATLFSIITSSIYFLISPLSEAQSELLARTQPTIYDVLIAFFGGLAGIIASSSKLKGNVLPGVAIATALMPPLCTAGFGIAIGNTSYFFGAIFLFFINTVYISLATYIVVRILKFPKKVFIDETKEKKFGRYISIIILITLIPSIYMSYNIIKTSVFENNANSFINNELTFPDSEILNRKIKKDDQTKEIEVLLIGKTVPDELIATAKSKLPKYHLSGTELIVKQGLGQENINASTIKALVMQDLYKNTEETIQKQNLVIDSLHNKLLHYKELAELSSSLIPEFKALFPQIKKISISYPQRINVEDMHKDSIMMVYLESSRLLSTKDKKTIEEWMKARSQVQNVKLIIEKN